MVLRQFEAATVVGASVVGCGIVGFGVGEGRGRGWERVEAAKVARFARDVLLCSARTVAGGDAYDGAERVLRSPITAASCKRHHVRACMMASC